jgi:hypothetical protein
LKAAAAHRTHHCCDRDHSSECLGRSRRR